MKRRQFITLLGGAAVGWPLAARAQQPAMPVIGFLGATSASAWSSWVAAFVQRLSERGWIDGRTVRIEYRWGDGRNERFAKFADELVRLNVDVIVTGGAAIPAAKQATSTIPIVFAVASDAIGSGYVESLARPGGNITGLTELAPDLAGKRLEILRSIVPRLRTLAIMADVGNSGAVLELGDVQTSAQALGLDVIRVEIQQAKDIAPAIGSLNGRANSLYVCADAFTLTNHTQISSLAFAARLPVITAWPAFAMGESLVSYGPNVTDMFRRAAEFVDKFSMGQNQTICR